MAETITAAVQAVNFPNVYRLRALNVYTSWYAGVLQLFATHQTLLEGSVVSLADADVANYNTEAVPILNELFAAAPLPPVHSSAAGIAAAAAAGAHLLTDEVFQGDLQLHSTALAEGAFSAAGEYYTASICQSVRGSACGPGCAAVCHRTLYIGSCHLPDLVTNLAHTA